MKALLASALTALVLVTTAWASNVTPAQLSALSKRVTKLEKTNRQLEAAVNQAAAVVDRQDAVVKCLRAGWNAQTFQAYATFGSTGWPTKSNNLTVLAAPSSDDGVAGTGYLVSVASVTEQC